jgi:alpha-ketoglutarate-dependent taurine dioxygenase
MHHDYASVTTRFLRQDERFMLSQEHEMPLVLEAKESTDVKFLKDFLATHSTQILEDLAHYGAILLRGFDISSDEDFEKSILSIDGFQGISDAFMSEEGRIHVDDLKFVLHTNAVYKTGGTLYLGGFHSENYYSTDVPAMICFCCLVPSAQGGETGLINMEKIYANLDGELKKRLELNTFFVSKWLVSEVAKRYQISHEQVKKVCERFHLPMIGEGDKQFILMYKPSIFEHPVTKKKSLQINLFEIAKLNTIMRQYFMRDYSGKTWFWHRLVWKLPNWVLKLLESIYIMFASFFYSPRESLKILQSKIHTYRAAHKKIQLAELNDVKVGTCFNDQNIDDLARLIREYYSSCLWKKGDILLVDNRKVMHAGMPGSGPRLVRALIGNPLAMKYTDSDVGFIDCQERTTETVGFYMAKPEEELPKEC